MKSLKVLMLNGSPHANGNTAVALREMEAIFKENDVDVETVVLGNRDIRGCVACGACAAVCPRHLIDLVPYKAEHLVQCNSHDKGADVKKKCDAGCIGCTLCTKQCEADAIHMDNNVAVIDYEKCTNCGKCAEKCPAKVIL